MKRIVVIGEGGHSKVVKDIIKLNDEYLIFAILDDKYENTFQENNIVYGPVKYAEELLKTNDLVFIIAIGNNLVRRNIADRLKKLGAVFATIIHPTSVISPSACIGDGTVVMPLSVINANTVIGNHVIVNTAALVEHENHIGDFAHISPGAVLTGNVSVGKGSQIGANSGVIPGKKIGNWSLVGAGAIVINDVPDNVTVVGVPARVISYLHKKPSN